MNTHHPDNMTPVSATADVSEERVTVTSEAERRAHVAKWIARMQKTGAATLGSAMLFLPVVAGAQTTGDGLVNAAGIDGVRGVELLDDGNARITFDNGRVLNVSAGDVVVGDAGEVQVSAQVADILADAAAAPAAGGGGGAAGAIVAGAAAGVAGIAAAGGGGGDGGGGGASETQRVFNIADVEGFETFSDVFGREPEGDPDRVTITVDGGAGIELTQEDGIWTLPEDFAENFAGRDGEVTVSFLAEREIPEEEDENGTVDVIVEDGETLASQTLADGEPDFEDTDSGSITLLVDTIRPTIDINEPITDGDVLNSAERGEDLTITGTTDAEDGQEVTVTVAGQTYTGTVSGGVWSVALPAAALAALPDGADITVEATVEDAAGNPVATPASVSFETDFTAPTIGIDEVSGNDTLTKANEADGVDITGTTDAEDGQEVSVTFNGETYPATVAGGTWSVSVPAEDLANLDTGDTPTISATVSDAAGNPAAAPATRDLDVDLTGPTLSIDPVADDDIINIAESGSDVTISGTSSGANGETVEVTIERTDASGTPTILDTTATADATTGNWSVTLDAATAGDLFDGGTFTIAANVTDFEEVPAPEATRDFTTDFTRPTIDIDEPITDGDVLNIAERDAGFDISGTTDAGDGQEVTVTLTGAVATSEVTETGIAQGGAWTVSFTKAKAEDLDGWDTVNVMATVEDAAGNDGQTTASFATDFDPPVVTIDALPLGDDTILNAAESENDLVITGTATDTDQVTVTVNGAAPVTGTVTGEAWSITIPSATLQGLDPEATIEVSAEAEDDAGNTGNADTSFATDFNPPSLTVDPLEIGAFLNIADAGGEVTVTGTVADNDGEDVTVSVSGQPVTASVDAQGGWTATFAAGALSALSDGETEFTVSTQDAAGNPATTTSASFTVDLTAPTITVDEPPQQGFVLDVAEREDADGFGFTTSETEGASITLSFTRDDGSETVDFTRTLQLADIPDDGGVFDFPLTPADLAMLEDETDYTVEIGISDAAGNTDTDGFTLSTDFEPSISLDEVVEGGVLILADIDPTNVSVSGTTRGVEAGQAVTVTLLDEEGATIFTDDSATVAADGTWTLDLPSATVEDLDAGQTYDLQVDVSNAAGRDAPQAQEQVVAYEAAQTYLVEDSASGSQVTMQILVDPRTEVPADGGFPVGETLSFDPTEIVYLDPPAPVYATGLTPLVNDSNASNGEVVFGGLGFLPSSFDASEDFLVEFAMEQQITNGVIQLDVSSGDAGNYSSLFGTDAADTIAANNVDTVVRGRGGDDAVDLSGAGVNTVQFEADATANGFDTVTDFSIGGPLPDRLGFAGLNNEDLRGGGGDFELLSGTDSVGADTGLIVFTTAMADLTAGSVQTAVDGLTGLVEGDDVLYFLASDGTDAQLYEVQVEAGDDTVTDMARFEGLGDLNGITEANILGFDTTGTPV